MGEGMKTAIDLYCGCGGMSVGAELAVPDLRVAYGLDRDPHACKTFAHNHPKAIVDCRPVAQATARDIIERAGIDQLDYFFAGPTCQAVSTMGLFYAGDPRNELFVHFARLLRELKHLGRQPRTVILENVPGVAYGGNVRIIADLFDFLEGEGYSVFADVLNLAGVGVPQLRYRFFLVASLDGAPPTFPRPRFGEVRSAELEPYVTVAQAIGDLFGARLSSDGGAVPYGSEPTSAFQAHLRGSMSEVLNHWCANTQEINLKRIAPVPPGGSWKDIPAGLLPERFHKVRMTDYSTLYGRLHEQNPSYTISASFANVTSGCFTHPRENRALSVREGARLQGFPDWFEVMGPRNAQYKQIGNAVPPLGMTAVVRHLETGEEGVPARLTPQTLRSGRKLPVLAPRFRSKVSDSAKAGKGYGGATFWPVGWGESPTELPRHKLNYRKTTEPLRYRRRDEWRPRRETTDLAGYVAQGRSFSLPAGLPLMGTLHARPRSAAVGTGVDGELFDRIGTQLLAIAAASPGDLHIQVPFRHIAKRIELLLTAYKEAYPKSFEVALSSADRQPSLDLRRAKRISVSLDPPPENSVLGVIVDLHSVHGPPAPDELDWGVLRLCDRPIIDVGAAVAAK